MVQNGGFDAIIGNPPFLVGKKISGALGSNLRQWLANCVAEGQPGNSDLVGYFLRRAVSLCKSTFGSIGLVTAKVISEGDTRQVAMDPIIGRVGIWKARRNEPWPSTGAATRIAEIWMVTPATHIASRPTLDGVSVASITASLEAGSRVGGLPMRLRSNSAISFKGYDFGDPGFLISRDEAQRLLAADARNSEVVRPFVNGKDLMSSPNGEGERFAIFFGERDYLSARSYSDVFAVAEQRLVNRKLKTDAWWRFHRPRPALTAALQGADFPIGISAVSRHAVPQLLPKGIIMGSAVVVFVGLGRAGLALLSSSVHMSWLLRWGSFMKQDIRYTPTDVFETYPLPEENDALERLGSILDLERRKIMLSRNIGLTALYNVVHDAECAYDPDIDRLRAIHTEIDAAVMAAYRWNDVPLDHGFHTYRQMERWTVSPAARVEILDRLLELNHERARVEGQDVPDQRQGTIFL